MRVKQSNRFGSDPDLGMVFVRMRSKKPANIDTVVGEIDRERLFTVTIQGTQPGFLRTLDRVVPPGRKGSCERG